MLNRFAQITVVAMVASLLSGCPKPYLAFEKHGGAFLVPVKGEQFVHRPNSSWESNKNAMVYFYRPLSQWGADEIDVPSVYIDDHHYFGIRANGYTWFEMTPGKKQITIRRPIGLLLGFEGIGSFSLEKIIDAEFYPEAGKVYYFRYSEVDVPSAPNPDLDPDSPFAKGDVQMVSRDVAIKDIVTTRYIESQPPFAKNSAGTSIVKVNNLDAYKAEKARLEEARSEELAQLKEQGYWRSASWYWPFGGGPTKRLKTDIELQKLEANWQAYEADLERKEAMEAALNKSKWWPF